MVSEDVNHHVYLLILSCVAPESLDDTWSLHALETLQIRHEATLFWSSSVRSEETWLSLEKLKLKAKAKVPLVHKNWSSPSGPTPRRNHHLCSPVEQTEMKAVQQFSYLGCVISSDAKIGKEVDSRLAEENTFGRLYRRVWNKNNLKKTQRSASTKLLCWPLPWMVPSRGSPAVATCASLSVSTSAASAAETISIETLLLKIQLRWAGRISRLEDHRLPKMVLCRELATGHCDTGAPVKRYRDLKKSLTTCRVDHRSRPWCLATPQSRTPERSA